MRIETRKETADGTLAMHPSSSFTISEEKFQ
jgi:hypothetical protein